MGWCAYRRRLTGSTMGHAGELALPAVRPCRASLPPVVRGRLARELPLRRQVWRGTRRLLGPIVRQKRAHIVTQGLTAAAPVTARSSQPGNSKGRSCGTGSRSSPAIRRMSSQAAVR